MAKRLLTWLALAGCAVTGLFADEAARAAARIVELEGTVAIHRGAQKLEAAFGLGLNPGDRVVTGADGRVVLVLAAAGTEFHAVSAGREIVIPEPPRGALTRLFDLARRAFESDEFARPAATRAATGKLKVAYPRDTAIREGRPTVTWEPVAGATGYAVEVRDVLGRVHQTAKVSEAKLVYPTTGAELAGGLRYHVQVTALPETLGVAGGADFERLDDEDRGALDAELAAAAAGDDKADVKLYARALVLLANRVAGEATQALDEAIRATADPARQSTYAALRRRIASGPSAARQ